MLGFSNLRIFGGLWWIDKCINRLNIKDKNLIKLNQQAKSVTETGIFDQLVRSDIETGILDQPVRSDTETGILDQLVRIWHCHRNRNIN